LWRLPIILARFRENSRFLLRRVPEVREKGDEESQSFDEALSKAQHSLSLPKK
jgi:hypothetical protein